MLVGGMILSIYLLWLPFTVYAEDQTQDWLQEQWSESGVLQLLDLLPEDTRLFLHELEFDDASHNGVYELNLAQLTAWLTELLYESGKTIFQSLVPIFGVLLLGALTESVCVPADRTVLFRVLQATQALLCALLLTKPILTQIQATDNYLSAVSAFQLGFIPIFAGTTAATGQMITAGKFAVITPLVLQGSSVVLSEVLLPLLRVCSALTVTTTAAPTVRLNDLLRTVYKTVNVLLSVAMTIFLGVLSLQSMVSSASDSVNDKTAQFLIGNTVPIVGNALSQAYGSVRGCVQLLKSGLGAFGMLISAVIVLPQVIQLFLWRMMLELCATAGNLFEQHETSDLLRGLSAVLGVLLGVLLYGSVLPILSTGILLAARSA